MDAVEKIPKTTANVGDMISSEYAKQKLQNRAMLPIILSSIRYLSRQGVALRGRYKSGDNDIGHVGGEPDSNFVQLLKLHAQDIPQLTHWMERNQDKFTSPAFKMKICKL